MTLAYDDAVTMDEIQLSVLTRTLWAGFRRYMDTDAEGYSQEMADELATLYAEADQCRKGAALPPWLLFPKNLPAAGAAGAKKSAHCA
jgi:hypothetical protein